MPIAGPLTNVQLRKYLDAHESDQRRRSRLFEGFGGPRAALINGLTDEILDFVVQQQDSLRKSVVLDYGCGVQPYRMAFEAAGAIVFGVDIGMNADAQVQISDGGYLPINNNSIDFVVGFQVLEHVPSPQKYLKECSRVLRPGGKLFLTTHGVWPYHPTPGDYHRWTRDGLISELERAGFNILSTGDVLNENSAAVQSFVINFHYRKKFKGFKKIIHWITNVIVLFLERQGPEHSQLPAIISILGIK